MIDFFFHSSYYILTQKVRTSKKEQPICFSIHIDQNINKLSDYFGAVINAKEMQNLTFLRSLHRSKDLPMKFDSNDGRIFSHYFAPVIEMQKGERMITPMRYRVRPQDSKTEIPTKYNVFNARLDALETRKTWIPLFGKKHGLIPFTHFYEWVEDPNEKHKKTKLIRFSPRDLELMWAPVLFDEWTSQKTNQRESVHFKSFAIITTEPPAEILSMGHDRCPIFLKTENIDEWLNPEGKSKKDLYEILSQQEEVKYKYDWVENA